MRRILGQPGRLLPLVVIAALSAVLILLDLPIFLSLGLLAAATLGVGIFLPPPKNPPAVEDSRPVAPIISAPPPEPTVPSADLSALRAEILTHVERIRLGLGDLGNALDDREPTQSTGPRIEDDTWKMELMTLKASSDFISENVFRAFEISDNLANTAKTAFELSGNVQSGVKIVTQSLAESLKQTGILFEQSKQISKILQIMSEVSEKIHILSINASIVSARAGTAGKGFEVVAKEIRNLAKETERSLEEIEQVIESVQSTINNVVSMVDTANKQTEREQNNLMSVAGALQGVILAVEIIRAVTSVAKEKAEEQKVTMDGWMKADAPPEAQLEVLEEDDAPHRIAQLTAELEELRNRINSLDSKEMMP